MEPQITSITPTEAERGTVLTISGLHFGVTAGGRDPNTMFRVNDVMIGGAVVRAQRWTDNTIEVPIPAHAVTGDVVVRLASSDPLPDGSCCAPVEYVVSNAVPLSSVSSIRADPLSGPVGTKWSCSVKGWSQQRTGRGRADRRAARHDCTMER